MTAAYRIEGSGKSQLRELVGQLRMQRRTIVGLVGPPGVGKSDFARALVDAAGGGACHVPMDGFHLADDVLSDRGLLARKGAPETFDAHGFAHLLERLGDAGADHTIHAPAFDRTLEQPVAGAIAVGADVDLVITEGNYLLLDASGWREVRSQLDEAWYLCTNETLRLERLVARHIRFGKTPSQARKWVQRVDEPNAELVAASRSAADRCIDLTRWTGLSRQ